MTNGVLLPEIILYLMTSDTCRHQRRFSDVFIVLWAVYLARELRRVSLNVCGLQHNAWYRETLAFVPRVLELLTSQFNCRFCGKYPTRPYVSRPILISLCVVVFSLATKAVVF